MTEKNKKLSFKDLSIPLKVAFVYAWFSIIWYALFFVLGVIDGLLAP